MQTKTTLFDIADALGVSTGTVHRALHDHAGVSPMTKARVLQMAKSMGYRPNLAARYLSQKRKLRISVNTIKGFTSFWDEVHEGITEEARSLGMDNVTVEFRRYPRVDEGEKEAFEAALDAGVNGIIAFPSRPASLRPLIRRAARAKVPVVCVATDAPDSGRLAVVSIDTGASGSLAADLMGRFRRGKGKVAVTVNSLSIVEHYEKYKAFEGTLKQYYPQMSVAAVVEDDDVEEVAREKCIKLFSEHPDLSGVYVTTEASSPVIRAAREAGILDKLTIVTTDLFPSLVDEIRSGAVTATIHQRPLTQGRMAFRVLYQFMVEGDCPSYQLTLAPHLVMRGNLDFFLQGESKGRNGEMSPMSADVG
jgi:LacI family transcriptional regulator